VGSKRLAAVAGPESPEKPWIPVPATVEIVPYDWAHSASGAWEQARPIRRSTGLYVDRDIGLYLAFLPASRTITSYGHPPCAVEIAHNLVGRCRLTSKGSIFWWRERLGRFQTPPCGSQGRSLPARHWHLLCPQQSGAEAVLASPSMTPFRLGIIHQAIACASAAVGCCRMALRP
jgi:hypothetical protein